MLSVAEEFRQETKEWEWMESEYSLLSLIDYIQLFK